MERTALVIGATGGVGGETAVALLDRGWRVRALHRHPDEARRISPDPRLEWVAGDAMDAASVVRAAAGAGLVFHGANPPGYKNWRGLAVPMLESTIAAARAAGATILFPGTVYNYGPEVFPRVRVTDEQRPRARKGAIRVEMERRLRASGVPVILLRCGDFFGARAKNSWFSQGMIRPGRPVRWILDPATPGVGHDWAYLPDVAATFAALVERAAELPRFAAHHFRGHWLPRGTELAAATARAAGTNPRIWRFPWLALPLAAPFSETMREMLEMRYLWREPLELVNDELVAVLGAEPHTPLDEAVRATLAGLGCT